MKVRMDPKDEPLILKIGEVALIFMSQKFWTQFEFEFFNPTPSCRGGIKIEVIKILVGGPMLLNMIFKANENKNKSRR